MTSLLMISSLFLIKSCRSIHKTASFIKKLLILVTLVALGGIGNAIEEAPWWNYEGSEYFNSLWDVCVNGFI